MTGRTEAPFFESKKIITPIGIDLSLLHNFRLQTRFSGLKDLYDEFLVQEERFPGFLAHCLDKRLTSKPVQKILSLIKYLQRVDKKFPEGVPPGSIKYSVMSNINNQPLYLQFEGQEEVAVPIFNQRLLEAIVNQQETSSDPAIAQELAFLKKYYGIT